MTSLLLGHIAVENADSSCNTVQFEQAAVNDGYSARWSRTRRVHRSLTFASILFGMFASFQLKRMRHETWDGSVQSPIELDVGLPPLCAAPHRGGEAHLPWSLDRGDMS